jgi:hypothetical protein
MEDGLRKRSRLEHVQTVTEQAGGLDSILHEAAQDFKLF